MDKLSISGREISSSIQPYVVAELSANHGGSISNAKSLIQSAAKCGAHAIKLQTYTPDTITINSDKEDFLIRSGPWSGYRLYDLYKEAFTPYEWHKELFDYAREMDITCFSSPFDKTAVDLLEDLNTPAYKIASFEAIDLPLIQYVAQTKKPMIISTGMANLLEIEEAVDCARSNGCSQIILLHCISAYPAPIEQSNLATIPDLAQRFRVPVGLSDHTLGTLVSTLAVALGACFIEKHFVLDRTMKGPDSDFSVEPEELKKLVIDTDLAWQAKGVAGYERKPSEADNVKFRRSIYFVNDLSQGDVITRNDIRVIRPGYGLEPKYYEQLIGCKVSSDVCRGDRVSKENIDWVSR